MSAAQVATADGAAAAILTIGVGAVHVVAATGAGTTTEAITVAAMAAHVAMADGAATVAPLEATVRVGVTV